MTSTPFSPRPLSGPSSNWSPAGSCPAADTSSSSASSPPAASAQDTGVASTASAATPPGPSTPSAWSWPSPRRPLRPHRADPAGPRRHAVSQTRPDSFRRGDAPRPLDVQQGLESLPRGARLGRPLPAPARALPGPDPGLRLARRLPPLQEPPGTGPGTPQGRPAADRSQPPHSTPTAGRTAPPVRRVVPDRQIIVSARQRLRRQVVPQASRLHHEMRRRARRAPAV